MTRVQRLGYLSAQNSMFFLCDVQEKFRFIDSFPFFIKNVSKLLLAGKTLNVPLIVSEQNPSKLGKTVSELNIDHAMEKFSKTQFSMITPEIKNILDKLDNVDSIILMGLESHICVEQTAMDLLSDGKYSVHIATDCILSRSTGDLLMALSRLQNMGCIISTSENIIFKLLKDKNI
ncbi:CLUMA_CG020837, isoform A [Clunio marinus]|uniref:Isochorismatase domain-containing protein 1 n=1 Tax=Clunio marinus TaxID=568069 RepID=A0A1J1J8E9_9DIPT|nr:CLUMA_CG020837, isoform A [Clunio marinus]